MVESENTQILQTSGEQDDHRRGGELLAAIEVARCTIGLAHTYTNDLEKLGYVRQSRDPYRRGFDPVLTRSLTCTTTKASNSLGGKRWVTSSYRLNSGVFERNSSLRLASTCKRITPKAAATASATSTNSHMPLARIGKSPNRSTPKAKLKVMDYRLARGADIGLLRVNSSEPMRDGGNAKEIPDLRTSDTVDRVLRPASIKWAWMPRHLVQRMPGYKNQSVGHVHRAVIFHGFADGARGIAGLS